MDSCAEESENGQTRLPVRVLCVIGTRPEVINKNLAAGQYFAVVERIFPPVGALPDMREYEIVVLD